MELYTTKHVLSRYLSKPFVERAMKYLSNNFHITDCRETARNIIANDFQWRDTEERGQFWYAVLIYIDNPRKNKLPALPRKKPETCAKHTSW